jgi:hypothetical protein
MTTLARKFGVELEGMCAKRMNNVSVGGWKGVSDASVSDLVGEVRACDAGCNNGGDVWSELQQRYFACSTCNGTHRINVTPTFHAVEMVSSAITNLAEIDEVFDELETHGWKVDDKCGLHVHVDATDFNEKDVWRVVMLNTMVEPLFFAMNDASRMSNQYCQPMSEHHMYRRVIEHGSNLSHGDLSYAIYGEHYDKRDVGKYNSERYYGLNLHAYFYHETLEFRYFLGAEDREYVKERVELCVKMVDFAKNATDGQLLVVVARLDQETTYAGRWAILKEVLSLECNIQPHEDGLANFDRSILQLGDSDILESVRDYFRAHDSVREVAATSESA